MMVTASSRMCSLALPSQRTTELLLPPPISDMALPHMLARVLLFCATVSMVGCATQPISNSQAKPVPADQVLDASLLQPQKDAGVVVVKRDSGVGGSACSSRVFVNGKAIADLNAAEKVTLYLPRGDYVLSAWPNGICGGGMSEVHASIAAGVETSFRIGYGSNGDFSIFQTAF